jgi:predicted transcriptional regulator
MTKDVTLSLRVDRKLSEKLDKEAKRHHRSKSALAVIAIENFLEIQEMEIQRIKRTLARVKAGEPTIPHEDVMRWIKSWGTPNELPPPRARRRKA